MKIGDHVQIKPNTNPLDCCQGKRGRIAHHAVGGGFLIHTDHFCPRAREEEELELIPIEVLAREIIEAKNAGVVQSYQEADEALLQQHAGTDRLAWAVLVLRGSIREEGE